MKAKYARDAKKLSDIPNIGPAVVRDLNMLGIHLPNDLLDKDPHILYIKLSTITGVRHDPCVLDTFIAAVDFMNGAEAKPWWWYTKGRKERYKI